MELKVLLHAIDVLEDIIDDTWHDSMKLRVRDDTLHGVGLTRRGLPVCKDGSIVPIEDICKGKEKANIRDMATSGA